MAEQERQQQLSLQTPASQSVPDSHSPLSTEIDTTLSLTQPNIHTANTVKTDRPESPVNRKRPEAGQDNSLSGDLDDHDSYSSYDISSRDISSQTHNAIPPTKRSKTSPPPQSTSKITESNLTEHRPSQEAGVKDDLISPQASPHLDVAEPRPIVSVGRRQNGLPKSPRPVVPQLTRSRTFEELRSGSMPPSSPVLTRHVSSIVHDWKSDETAALGSLNLGDSNEAMSPARERAMGVITSRPGSRQSSPGLPNIKMTSRETTPLHLEEFHSQQQPRYPSSQPQSIHPLSSSTASSPKSADDTDDPESPYTRYLIETSPEYDEDADEDYDGFQQSGTTADDGDTRRYSDSDNEDEDEGEDEDVAEILDGIDVHNIETPTSVNSPFKDVDPACQDTISDRQKNKIMQEARSEGIAFVVQKYIMSRLMTVKKLLLMTDLNVPYPLNGVTENKLIEIFTGRMDELLRKRDRLDHIHTLDQVIDLLKSSKRIMVLTGAGVSVSCGIPDFRSPDGIYARLSEFELDDPTQMFDWEVFCERPDLFYSFAREIYPSNFTPSPSHHFIKLLEERGQLLRNYTQNIDTLEHKAGIQKLLQCHGSFATASCIRCRKKVDCLEIQDSIMAQRVAWCTDCPKWEPPASQPAKRKTSRHSWGSNEECSSPSSSEPDYEELLPSVMKPDIVFFGEPLPVEFDRFFDEDKDKVDLLIVMGSSLKVQPVSSIMYRLPPNVPQILINRTPITHTEFDVQLLGNCDTIVAELCRMAGWELKHEKLPGGTSNVSNMDTNTNEDGAGEGGRADWTLVEPNTYLFDGALLGTIDYEQSQGKGRKRAWMDADDDERISINALNESFRRRESSHRERFGSVGMDIGSESEDSQDENQVQSVRFDDSFAANVSSFDFSQHNVYQDESWSSASATQHQFGFVHGTIEPQSGNLADIHNNAMEATEGSLGVGSERKSMILTHSRHGSDASSLGDQAEEDEAQAEMRARFTEVMPKDLDESSDDSMDRAEFMSAHSRRSSAVSLEAITEEMPEMDGTLVEETEEEDESKNQQTTEDTEILATGGDGATSASPVLENSMWCGSEPCSKSTPPQQSLPLTGISEPMQCAVTPGSQEMSMPESEMSRKESYDIYELPSFTAEEIAELDKIV
ncbi:NAD-dependent histone deacetylase sir2 [Podila humilis]|nr:NAD-dependent histone deacetylase sir2 [Podila humilis]